MNTTTVLAIYGAGLSTVLGLWTIYRDVIQTRKRLEIRIFLNEFHDIPAALIFFSNVGYRPVTIIGIDAKDKDGVMITYSKSSIESVTPYPPFRLGSGDTELYTLGGNAYNKLFNNHENISIRITDATGKVYKDYKIHVRSKNNPELKTYTPRQWAKQK